MFASIRRSIVAVATVAVFASCGSDEVVTVQSPETITYAASLGVTLSSMNHLSTGVYTKDLVVGTGAEAVNGKTLGVKYYGYLNDGTLFQTNTVPFVFVLGNGEVIQGWEKGLLGMKVGGRRQLVIPPLLGYGNYVNGDIPPGSVLIFTVELLSMQ